MTVDLANDVHDARQKKPGNCRVEMRVQMADADGAVLSGVDLNEEISMYTTVSDILPTWATTQSTRRFGGSMVVLYEYSTMAMGTFSRGCSKLLWIQRGNGEWGRDILEHEMNRPEDYGHLLELCRREIPRSEASDLLVQ